MRYVLFLFAALLVAASPPQKGSVERFKVHGTALEGNLAGDSPNREVSVYLPPSYKTDRERRYPVVYVLHGFTESNDKWFETRDHWINLPYVVERALGNGKTREMILVMPDAFTRFQGSMYSNSVVTGDWEYFINRELVAYIDSRYRTLAQPESRGLAGHSMGGYGTIRLGMKFVRTFSVIYALSPCCLAPNMNLHQQPGNVAGALRVKSFSDIEKADFGTKIALAHAAAWSPNPKNPPLYVDLPWKDGQFQPQVAAKWNANAPLAMIDQFVPNLKRLRGIAFDAGDLDVAIAASVRSLDQVLTLYGIAHESEVYPGTHNSHVADRIEKKMLPFFSKLLSFQGPQR